MRWLVLFSGCSFLFCAFGGGCASERDESGGGISCEASGSPDDDCTALGKPLKFDCESAEEQRTGLGAGCVAEDPNDADDFDVCCPEGVQSKFASLADFCAKCQQCVSDPGFSEGFCTPFASGSNFNLSACVDNADETSLEQPVVERATLSGWSCAEFDTYE